MCRSNWVWICLLRIFISQGLKGLWQGPYIFWKFQVALGGGGGDIGKHINHGGGDGGDDDGDDDDYFDDFDDGDEGDEGGLFRRRIFLEEVGMLSKGLLINTSFMMMQIFSVQMLWRDLNFHFFLLAALRSKICWCSVEWVAQNNDGFACWVPTSLWNGVVPCLIIFFWLVALWLSTYCSNASRVWSAQLKW